MALVFTSLLRAHVWQTQWSKIFSEWALNKLKILSGFFQNNIGCKNNHLPRVKTKQIGMKKKFISNVLEPRITRKLAHYRKIIFLIIMHLSFHWNGLKRTNLSLNFNGMKTRMLLQKWFYLIVVPITLVSLKGQHNLFSSGWLITT